MGCTMEPSFSGCCGGIRKRRRQFNKMVKLTPEQVQFYKDNGYIKLTNIFTEKEMDEYSAEYMRLFTQKNNPELETSWITNHVKKLANNEDFSVQSIHNLQFHSAAFTRLLLNENLLDALESVMGTSDILLHHNKAHMKPPRKGAPYVMHQDYHYFPFKNDSMVAAFIHMNKIDPDNGGLCIYPGSHKHGPLEDIGVLQERDHYGGEIHYMDPEKYPIDKATPVYAERGDVVIFSYLTLHGSYRNLSDRPRCMFLIQARAADDEPLTEIHQSEGQGMVLRGKNDNKKASMLDRFAH